MNERKITTAYCLFEQSGTFKNEFKKLGIYAEDYDINNKFGETDHVVDLFREIEQAYNNKPSVFDEFDVEGGVIMAFFPCTRFSAQILLTFWQDGSQHKKLPTETKLERNIQLQKELTKYYILVTQLVLVCIRRGFRLILENPCGAIPAKPDELIRILIRCFSPPHAMICDPFSGSGIVPIESILNDSDFIASEIDKDRADAINQKLKETYRQETIFDFLNDGGNEREVSRG